MKQEIMLSNREDSLQKDGMLFVRTKGILTTMVRVPIIIIGLMVVAITIPAQLSLGSTKNLDLTIYSDGSTHVNSEISVNPLDPDYSVELFGTEIDNFVAEDENGFFLSSKIQGNIAVVETLGASTLTIDYDTHDLISKQGRIWSFNIDSPIDYNLLMPKNIVIVGMSNYPLSMQIIDDQSHLSLPSGPLELNYFFGVSTSPPNSTPTPTESNIDNSFLYVGGGIAAAVIIGALFLKRSKQVIRKEQVKATTKLETDEKPLDTETIFKLKPELREDDKELINFISSNGGQAFESELRKKFLQPRTTMWRAVKRLERHGIIEIEKKELQNLVKLKKKLEDEQ
jgi:uncharacterized membrane protein